ncbi:MAG: HAMP domain-containing histidine kinase, partial [Pseudarcicella sp.]|nr:HAMP domain-containing histidine kinase [Pseudarcicella sp.]
QKIKSNRIISSQKQTLDELNATKDKLFSIVSHDLRSSVNARRISNTKLADNLLNKKYELLDHQLQNNSAIANGTYSLLDNLLNWAMLQTKQLYFQIESIHLYSVIQQVAFNFEPLMLNKNIHFESDIPKSIFVMADTESLKIVLRNVLDNALKFSKENGFIKIYTSNTPNNITLTIEDSGAGMSKEIAQELMKDTVVLAKKNSTEQIGSGLGLQLCKSMIKKNNGSFAIESIEQKGTKILITLPKQ